MGHLIKLQIIIYYYVVYSVCGVHIFTLLQTAQLGGKTLNHP